MINVVISPHWSWAKTLLSFVITHGLLNYFLIFAYVTQSWIKEEAMLSGLVGFFNVVIGAKIDTFWALNSLEQICMSIVFEAGFLLMLAQFLASSGTIVYLKYGRMAVAFNSLSLACYFDKMDSDGIVG